VEYGKEVKEDNMSFPENLASTLSGVSTSQLYRWRKKGLLVPEASKSSPALYSFRDIIALRTMAFLRSKVSFQKIRKAFENLHEYDLYEHPSAYKFGSDGKTVVAEAGGEVIDLVLKPGQMEAFTMEEIFQPFTNMHGETVVDLRHPMPRLEVNPKRMGGWPTIAGTRVPYDSVSSLLADKFYSPEHVSHFYPTVDVEGARDALAFDELVGARKRGA